MADVPPDAHAARVEQAPGGLGDLGPDPVARDEHDVEIADVRRWGHDGDTIPDGWGQGAITTATSRSASTPTAPWPQAWPVVFVVALAVGALIHTTQTGAQWWTPHAALGLAAFAVLHRPASVGRFMLLLGVLVVELLWWVPVAWNHSVLLGLAGFGILVWWAPAALRRRPAAWELGSVVGSVAWFLRAALIAVWFAAALAKVNSGYLEPLHTCAVWVVQYVPGAPVDAVPVSWLVAGTLGIEFAVPVLLLIPRLRLAGVALAWVFHLVAALGGHAAFSGFAFALYLLFFPGALAAAVLDVLRQGADRVPPGVRATATRLQRSAVTWIVLAAAWLVGVNLLQLLSGPWTSRALRWGATLPYLVWALAGAVVVVLALRRTTDLGDLRLHAPNGRQVVLLLCLGVLLVNAASPYVGLKTRYSFTMYSNLRTEPGFHNHLLVPERLRVFDLQDDLVMVADTDDPRLAADLYLDGSSEGTLVVRTELERLAGERPDARLRLLDETGEPLEVDGRDLAGPDGFLARHLGGFRPIPLTPRCQH
jgi:hypothetical protein